MSVPAPMARDSGTAPGARDTNAWSPFETAALAVTLALQAVLRVLYILHHRADSDESQHLHVVWGWTQGLVQYRDLFDNHVPLFHLVMAPWLSAFGERADIVVIARWLMLPLVAVSLAATYRIARTWCSRRASAWMVGIAGLVPGFLLTSTEFRTDILWMAAWLCAVAVLLRGAFTARRALVVGLLLGVALATSLKTILLLLSLGLAAALTPLFEPRAADRDPPSPRWRAALMLIAGLVFVPAVVAAVFWRLHALGALLSCTIGHNLLPGLGRWEHVSARGLILPLALLVVAPLVAWPLRRSTSPDVGGRPVLLLLTTAMYLALLEGTWPLVTKEDFLPVIPLIVVLCLTPADRWVGRAHPSRASRLWPAAALAGVALELALLCGIETPWMDANREETTLLQTVLRETRPGEPILDLKGETIYRPRSIYLVLEGITKARLAKGLLADPIAGDIVRTHTHFAVADNYFFPPAGRRFLNAHFVPFGVLRVLGSELSRNRAGEAGVSFDVAYPERFALLADGAPAHGKLDGLPYRSPRRLSTGLHVYRPAAGERQIIAVWAGAVDRRSITDLMAMRSR